MRVAIQVGYQWILFANDANIGQLLEAVGKARAVSQKYVDGKHVFEPAENTPIEVKLLDDESLALPGSASRADGAWQAIERLTSERDKAQQEKRALERELKKIREAAATPDKKETA